MILQVSSCYHGLHLKFYLLLVKVSIKYVSRSVSRNIVIGCDYIYKCDVFTILVLPRLIMKQMFLKHTITFIL